MKLFRAIAWVLAVGVLLFSSWKLGEFVRSSVQSRNSYNSLEQYVSVAQPRKETRETEPGQSAPQETIFWPEVDFDALAQINEDVVGWIYIPDTNIHYPIVQGSTNEEYLYQMFDGVYAMAGSIFLDYRCQPDFSGRNSVIYGHHMKDNTMFTALEGYKDQPFYDAHDTVLLLTPTQNYRIRVFSAYVSDTEGDAWVTRFDDESYAAWLQRLRGRSVFISRWQPDAAQRTVTLSTCTYEFEDARFVVHGFIDLVQENA